MMTLGVAEKPAQWIDHHIRPSHQVISLGYNLEAFSIEKFVSLNKFLELPLRD